MSNKMPQIRFNGYSDAWEERKLSDIADRFDNLRVPITASDRKSGDTPYYGANGIQDYVEGFTHDGEFILVAEDGANDLKNYPVQYVNGKVWVNNHAHVLQGKKTITDNKFLMNSIKNFNIEPFLVGGGRAKLNADVMMKLNVLLPTFEEQEKIGSFFKQLDDTITLHQRKLDLLKEQKKGYLQKMFPKNGEKVPELRFAGFADDWVQRKLSDGYKKIRNAFVGTATPFYVESGHFYLESNNVKNGQLNFNSKVFINDEFYQKQTDQLLNTGDLVMVQSGHVGHTAVIPEKLDGTAAHALIMFKNNDGSFDSNFVNQYFQTDRAKNAISIITTGNTIKHILASDMQKFDVMVPSVEEQKQISLLLQRLDNLIAANQRKLDLLKEQKKGFLQNMFV